MNKYNPTIHHRRSIRLKGYDYSQAGLYFITICCQDRVHRFGDVINGEMILNEYGQIAHDEWIKLSERFPNFEIDVFQIMPNHMHGIIALLGATLAVAPNGTTVAPNGTTVAPNETTVAPNGTTVAPNGTTVAPNGTMGVQNGTVDENDNGISIRATARVAPTVANIVGAYKSWSPMVVCLYTNRKMKQWGNYGNAIITNTLFAMNNRIKPYRHT